MYYIKKIIFCLFVLHASVIYAAASFKQYILNNGLKVIIKEDHYSPTIALQVWYKANDNFSTSNTHALLQQMITNVNNDPHIQYLKKTLFAMGDKYNVITTPEYSLYTHLAPANQLENILKLEAYNMSKVLLDDEVLFNREKYKYLAKVSLDNSTHQFRMILNKFYKIAYDSLDQSYNNIYNNVAPLQLQDLNNYYKNWYTPNNTVLILVGDVNVDTCYKLLQNYFGKTVIYHNGPTISNNILKSNLGYRRLEVKMPINNYYLLMSYNVPSLNTTKYDWEPCALKILSVILQKLLLKYDKLFNVTEVSYNPFHQQSSLMYLSLIPVDAQSLTTIENVIQQTIERLKTELIANNELESIKNKILAEREHMQQSLFEQIYNIGMLEIAGYNFDVANYYNKAIKNVTTKQLQSVAKKYFVKDRVTLMYVLPEEL